ncbi:MAG: hypothetical protein EOM11_10990 [Erysipelotrichia bacterium]|nr:hypothetical protein [Erysipelotrichia bacterium]
MTTKTKVEFSEAQNSKLALKHTELMELKKTCTQCGKKLPFSEFHKDVHCRNGLSPACKKCRSERKKLYMTTDKYKEGNLKRNYGITLNEYRKMYEEQNHKCLICSCNLKFYGKSTHVDHNHKSGRIRGLLCGNCNSLIGFALDDASILNSAINYLDNAKNIERIERWEQN